MTKEILALPYECWGWFPGYVGLYQVSTRGQVRRVGRWVTGKDGKKRFIKGRILKPWRDKKGYLCVTLCRNDKKRILKVHRMVLEVWGDGNPENKPQIHHRDEDKSNNSVENLSYCTAKENNNWGTRNKRMAASKSKPVQAIDPRTGAVVKEFPSAAVAGRNGFNHGHISECCQGNRKIHKGYMWRYKE